MYAHQVISDFAKLANENLKENIKEYIQLFLNGIRKSHKFHFGNIEPINNSINKEALHPNIFLKENKKYIKLPYKICWFDYILKDHIYWVPSNDPYNIQEFSKIGILASYSKTNNNEKIILLYPVLCTATLKKRWQYPFGMSVINLTNNTSGFSPFEPDINHPINMMFKYNKDIIIELFGDITSDFLNLLLLLNCKNIKYIENQPSQKLNKKKKKRKKQELFSYYTLIIKMGSNQYKSFKQDRKVIGNNRIHFCRGHIKKYTNKAPLLGRHVGSFWWESHVRGNKNEGIIMKDYKIKKDDEDNES